MDDAGRFEDAAAFLGASQALPELRLISAASFAGKPVPRRQWIVEDKIPVRVVTLMSGDGGTGKSLLALQLGIAAVTGTDWLGTLPERGGVLYLSAEDELDEHHRRCAAITASRDMELSSLRDLHILDLAGDDATLAAPDGRSGGLTATPLWRALDLRLAALRPKLLIVDNAADVFGGDEIKRGEVRRFVNLLTGAALRYDMGVLLLAHPSVAGMASGSGISGSTAWNNSVRSRLYLDRPKEREGEAVDPDVRTLRTKKANYGAIGGEIALRWTKGAFRLESSSGSVFDRAAAAANAEAKFLELLTRFAGQGRDVSDKPGSTYAPAIFADEADASATKQVFKRAMAALFQAGKIRVEVHGPQSRRRSRIVLAE